jgi:hypothetical protein
MERKAKKETVTTFDGEAQKIWITVSNTINTGNYNSVKVDAGYTKAYTDNDNPIEMIEAGVAELLKSLKKKTKEIRMKAKIAKKY